PAPATCPTTSASTSSTAPPPRRSRRWARSTALSSSTRSRVEGDKRTGTGPQLHLSEGLPIGYVNLGWVRKPALNIDKQLRDGGLWRHPGRFRCAALGGLHALDVGADDDGEPCPRPATPPDGRRAGRTRPRPDALPASSGGRVTAAGPS